MFSRSQDRTARPRGGMGGLSFIGPEMTIGGDVSSGCIRMTNEDVIDLYGRAQIGAKVIVL